MRKRHSATTILGATLGSLVLLNVLSVNNFFRVDLTRDRMFTLSQATKDTLDKLEDPVAVTAYFTAQLPPPFSSSARYVRDMLEEFRARSEGNVSFEFVDPQSQETAEDKEKKKELKRDIFGRAVRGLTSVETDLEKLGVRPVEIRVVKDDQAQTKRAYMGIVIRYREKTEVIPVVESVDTLEYNLTTMVRRLTRVKTPVVGVLQGHGEPNPNQELERVTQLLQQNYEIRPLPLEATDGGGKKVPDDVDALLVIGPKQEVPEDDRKAIDAFLMKGKSAAFFVDRIQMDLKTFEPAPVTTGLDDMLAAYGVEVGSQLVGDVECASLSVQERRGYMVVQMPVRYPFIPAVRKLVGDSPLTKGVTDVTLPFASPLYPKRIDGLELAVLATSSAKSWIEDPTPDVLNPRRDYNAVDVAMAGPYNLIVQGRGVLPSAFAAPGGEGAAKSAGETRIVVIGTSTFLQEQILGPQNAALLMNTVDWLLLDQGLLEMRTRGLAEAPLKPDLSEATRTFAKYGNLLGAPLLLLLYGLLRWRLRQAKRNALIA